jgi:hypothetical protein
MFRVSSGESKLLFMLPMYAPLIKNFRGNSSITKEECKATGIRLQLVRGRQIVMPGGQVVTVFAWREKSDAFRGTPLRSLERPA